MKKMVLDIETIPATDEILEADEAKKAALDALSGRIICIGSILLDDIQGPVRLLNRVGR